MYTRLSAARRIARTLRQNRYVAAIVPYDKVGSSAVKYANTHDEAWK